MLRGAKRDQGGATRGVGRHASPDVGVSRVIDVELDLLAKPALSLVSRRAVKAHRHSFRLSKGKWRDSNKLSTDANSVNGQTTRGAGQREMPDSAVGHPALFQ